MEFTKLIKYVSASLILILIGLICFFPNFSLLLIVLGLLLFLYKMEQSLILSEREQFNTKISDILTDHQIKINKLCNDHDTKVINLHKKYTEDQQNVLNKMKVENDLIIEKFEALKSQVQTLKTGVGMSAKKRFNE